MKKMILMLVVFVVFSLISGCMIVQSPVAGMIYTDVKAPLATGPHSSGTKVGKAVAHSYVGVIGVGDASIQTAATNGGITRIHHVDYEAKNILGVVGTFTTVVYGE